MYLRRIPVVSGCLLGGLLLAAGVAYLVFKGSVYTIRLGREDIQRVLDARVPYERDFLHVLNLRVTDAEVDLREGHDRVGISAEAVLTVRAGDEPQRYAGRIVATAGMRYDRRACAVHLTAPAIEDILIAGVPSYYIRPVARNAHLALHHIAEAVPVHEVQDRTLKDKLLRAVLRDTRICNGRVEIDLGY